MMRLKSKLLSLNASKSTKVKVYSPRNCEELRIPFKADKTAKVVGKLAAVPPPVQNATDSALVTGVLVQNDFKLSLMAPEDLREYAGLNTTTIMCKQRLRLGAAGIDLVRWALEGTFGAVEELPEMRGLGGGDAPNGDAGDKVMKDADEEDKGKPGEHTEDAETGAEKPKPEEVDGEVSSLVAAYLIMGCIAVRYRTDGEVELEWEGNMLNDSIADSVMAVLFSVESSPAAVKRSSANGKHAHHHGPAPPAGRNPHANCSPAERLERLFWFLEAQFGADNVSPVDTPKLPPAADHDDDSGSNGPKKDDGGGGDEGGKMVLADGDAAVAAEANDAAGDEAALEERRGKEIERLHRIGIPVPGVRIKVDKMVATVWLEDLEIECNNKVFADRVRAVMERAVEVTAPLWA